MIKGKLIKLNKVIGFFYPSEVDKSIAIINLAGAPGFGDSGNSKTAQVCNSFGVSYLNPDYIGMCRSGGEFNFKSSVETIYESINFLTGKLLGTDIKTGKKLAKQKFNEIILLGSSFGGSIAPFFEKIKNEGLVKNVFFEKLKNFGHSGLAVSEGVKRALSKIRV